MPTNDACDACLVQHPACVWRDPGRLAESLTDQPDHTFAQDLRQAGIVDGGRFDQPDEELGDQTAPRQAPGHDGTDKRPDRGVSNGHQRSWEGQQDPPHRLRPCRIRRRPGPGRVVQRDVPIAECYPVVRVFYPSPGSDTEKYPVALGIAGADPTFGASLHDLAVRRPGELPDFEVADLCDRHHRKHVAGRRSVDPLWGRFDSGFRLIVFVTVERVHRSCVVQRPHGDLPTPPSICDMPIMGDPSTPEVGCRRKTETAPVRTSPRPPKRPPSAGLAGTAFVADARATSAGAGACSRALRLTDGESFRLASRGWARASSSAVNVYLED